MDALKWGLLSGLLAVGCAGVLVEDPPGAEGAGGDGSGGGEQRAAENAGEGGQAGLASGGAADDDPCAGKVRDDVPGAGGDRPLGPANATGCDAAVIRAAERAVDPDQVVVDEDAIVGHGFTLATSLCPTGAWPDPLDSNSGGDSLATFYVRAAANGLELVTSTGGGGDREVEVTPMHRSALGWNLAGVGTCARNEYAHEDWYRTKRHESEAMHVVFFQDEADGELRAVVAVGDEQGPIVSSATPDVTPPSYERIEVGGVIAAIDDFDASAFAESFVFSEPVGPESEVEVTDPLGSPVSVSYLSSGGYRVGFGFKDAIAGEVTVRFQLADLSLNTLETSVAVPMLELAPTSGDFEDQVDAFDPRNWNGFGSLECNDFGVAPSLDASQSPAGVDLPALAGQQSFVMGSGVEYADCSVSFRLERAAGASAILFDARRIGGANGIGPSPVELCVSSLTAGGDDHCNTQAAAWTEDPAFENEPVSQQLTLSFPLPAGIDDLLVTITTNQLLWLDSLRTE